MFKLYYAGFLFLFFISCSSGNDHSSASSQSTDTRVLVQEAFTRIQPIDLGVAFTEKRIKTLEEKLAIETDPGQRLNMSMQYGTELLKMGRSTDAIYVYEETFRYIIENNVEIDAVSKRTLMSMIAIAYLRKGEIENCQQNHTHESCFVPIKDNGVHTLKEGSRGAINWYLKILEEFPDDLDSRYLLNIAYMTLGEYPNKVPSKYRIPEEWMDSKIAFPKFKEIAGDLGLNQFGLAGGSIIDDFTNDGWLDIVITSWGVNEELIFYVNNGDGTFSDQTEAYGLKGQVECLHLNQVDFNNDGWMDMFLMRGGWWAMAKVDMPHTLLMNTGKGTFEDVTIKAGLTQYACNQASAWADYNLDGWLDVVIANESPNDLKKGIFLYINQQDGTFKQQASEYGLTGNGYYKGCVASDVNNDKYPDIYITDLDRENILYINTEKDGKRIFELATSQYPGYPGRSFPCWSFDYNNDGLEDLFASGYLLGSAAGFEWMESKLGKSDPNKFPKLYRNTGNLQFEEVGQSMGLNEVALTMGCNFGDINTDGFLDFYLATGNPLYQSLGPNKMYLNVEGKKFEDVSYAGGFANIQKGHSVSFGDLDHDGDEDFYVVMGGAYEADGYYNCLFENPNAEKNNWIVLNLTGSTANKPAIGARVRIVVEENGVERQIWRTVSSGSSFGANSLAIEAGLGKATSIKEVAVQWPCKDCPDQNFKGLTINKAYRLEEGKPNAQELKYTYSPFSSKAGKSQHSH